MRSKALFSVFLAAACVKPKGTSMGGDVRQKAASVDNAGTSSAQMGTAQKPAPDEARPGENNTRNSVLPNEGDLEPDAVAPAIVSGSFLNCSRSAVPLVVACDFRDVNGKEVKGPAKVQFLVQDKAGKISDATVLLTLESPAGFTEYYVSMASLEGTLKAKNAADPKAQDLDYPMSKLPGENSPENIRIAMPVGELEIGPTNFGFFKDAIRLGDYAADPGEDACLAKGEGKTVAKGVDQRLEIYNFGVENATLYMTGICSLQKRGTRVTLSGPEGFMPLAFELVSTAKSGDQMLIKGLKMPPGSYTIRVDTLMDGTGYEDFSFVDVKVVSPTRSNADYEWSSRTNY